MTLKNVSFTVEAGETLAIVGYNGSGNLSIYLISLLMSIFFANNHDSILRLHWICFGESALSLYA